MVDPQLKNNTELVDCLVEFENSWSQGLTYFMDSKKLAQLLHFSQVIEAAAEKHTKFAELLEERDAEIFIMIPALLVLKNIENDDKQIGCIFYPDLANQDSEQGRQATCLRVLYESLIHKKGKYELYNLIEKCLLSVPLTTADKATL